MSPSGGKDRSTREDHPWEKDCDGVDSGVAYLAERELQASNAETQMMPAVMESALSEPVADAGVATGKVAETAVEAAAVTEATAKTAAKPLAASKPRSEDVPPRHGNRVSKPVVAAAAVAGLVLLSVPLLISGLSGNDDTPTKLAPVPANYEDEAQAQSGFVPGMAQDPVAPPPPVNPVPGPPPPPAAPGNGGSPQPPADAPPADPVPAVPADSARTAANPVVFSAFGGPGCAGSSFSRPGYHTDGDTGWTSSTGAHAADGCDGSYFSLPMSGDPNRDRDNAAIWRFTTGDVKQGSCQVFAYVPNGGITKAGGDPSYYSVYQSDQTRTPVGDFQIFQANRQGSWVDGGRFPVTNGMLTIKLHDRGVDWTSSGPNNAHHAAAQMKVDCKA